MAHTVECPHCGHIIRDLWDLDWRADVAEIECSSCGLPVEIEREHHVTYTARQTTESEAPNGN